MHSPSAWFVAVQVIALAIPAILVVTALAAPRQATLATTVTLGLAFLFIAGAALAPPTMLATAPNLGVRIDLVTCVMLLLVCTIAWVIVRYSRTYMHGDTGVARYFKWLLLTLGAVTLLVIANNLLVLAMAWTTASLFLHQLLAFYSERTAALVAAHKKFLVSRLADLCIAVSLVLVHSAVGSFSLNDLAEFAAANPELNPAMQVAASLVVIAVALRSAQLPFHGWLIQVMEAPTPVSALLHAGVVNIGGFVLIRLAPWLAQAPLAQLLLVIIGLTSAMVAALVMTTRVSVKVSLAWSTCAQMGFMLVQCGLGLWHLAMLHLVAHSLYKAHAFLSTGTAVDGWRLQSLAKQPALATWRHLITTVLASVGTAALLVFAMQQLEWISIHDPAIPVLTLLVSLSLIPLFPRSTNLLATATTFLTRVTVIVTLYVALHLAAAQLMPYQSTGSHSLGWVLVGLGFSALFVLKVTLQLRPKGRLAAGLYPWLFAGLYLDERFTRLTFRLWPPKLTQPSSKPSTAIYHTKVEARP